MDYQTLSDRDIEVFDTCAPIADLPQLRRLRLRAVAHVEQWEAGTMFLEEGSKGTTFYILLDGIAEVVGQRDGNLVHLADLRRGDYFGAHALLIPGNKRTASVRAITACRIASIDASDFHAEIAAEPVNRHRFEADAAHFMHRLVSDSLREFLAKVQEGAPGLERLTYSDGDTVVQEGTHSDAVYFVLSGNALATKVFGDVARELARIGPNQLFGELGVLHGEPRAATVTADGPLEVMRIDASTFLKWHRDHPSADGFFKSLARIYTLAQNRRITILLGEHVGKKTVTSIAGDAAGGVVSTKIIGEDSIVFHNPEVGHIQGQRDELCYSDGRFTRILRVIVTARKGEVIESCILYGVRAEGIESDLGTLYRFVSDLSEIEAMAIKRFQRTGFLGGTATPTDRLCACLGLGPQELSAAVSERGVASFESLQADTGVGSVCGGCDRSVRAFLDHNGTAPMALDTIVDVPSDSLSDDERQLAALIAEGMSNEGMPVSRQQLAVRLRTTGVRDMISFIELLFPDVFTSATKATPAALASAVGRGIGFVPWRRVTLRPRPLRQRIRRLAVITIYRLGRFTVLMLLLISVSVSFALSPYAASITWSIFTAAIVTLWFKLPNAATRRFILTSVVGGPARYYRALWRAFGRETQVGVFGLSASAPKTYFVRDEKMVDQVLQHPDTFAREGVWEYPPFGAHSMLGGGSSGVWLGYRLLFEEYFSETYRDDLVLMRSVVRERMCQWKERHEILLLDELYRIVLELRARVFFQGTFGCFKDDPDDRFVSAVDHILGPEVQLFNSMAGGDVKLVRERVKTVLQGSTRPKSLGGIIQEAQRKCLLNEHEALDNATMYTLAQAPTMALFWTIYRAARTGSVSSLHGDRKNMVRAIKEELRLHAPVTSMFTRKVLRDTRLGDHVVEKGNLVNLCPMFVHTNPAQWSSPMDFDSQRWEVHAGDGSEIVNPKTDPSDSITRPASNPGCPHSQRYIPFGGGGQACQGRWFAADEMLIVLEEVLAHFDLEVLEDKELLDLPLHDQVLMHIYNRPANEVRLRLIPRN